MPIVHGLERRFEGRVDFFYLHVGEPRTSQAREQLGYVATPQIMLLNPRGQKVREWIGIVDEPTLAAGLEALARR